MLSYQAALVHDKSGPWIRGIASGVKMVISLGPCDIAYQHIVAARSVNRGSDRLLPVRTKSP